MTAEDNGNGKVTLALLGQKIEQLTGLVTAQGADVKLLLDQAAHQEEFNKAVKCQIWEGSNSRIQTALDMARNSSLWSKVLFVPLTISAILGIAGFIKYLIC